MKTVTLNVPLPYGDNTLKELTFRDPKAGDLRGLHLGGLSTMDVDLLLKLTARLSVQPLTEAHLVELHPSDLLKVTEAVVGFFEPPPPPTTQP